MNLHNLVKLGLSNDEAQLYSYLVKHGAHPVDQLAKSLRKHLTAVYRLATELEDLGLITTISKRPEVYQALPPETCLPALVEKQSTAMLSSANLALADLHIEDKAPQARVEILTGKKALYDQYVKQATTATKEILIYAIGVADTPEIRTSLKDSLSRGVTFRNIVQKNDDSNRSVVRNRIKMGLDLRYDESRSGLHLMIFDKKVTILSTSDPAITDERTSFVLHNWQVSAHMRDYFNTLWRTAKKL